MSDNELTTEQRLERLEAAVAGVGMQLAAMTDAASDTFEQLADRSNKLIARSEQLEAAFGVLLEGLPGFVFSGLTKAATAAGATAADLADPWLTLEAEWGRLQNTISETADLWKHDDEVAK